jgi:uncharacterized protein (DUF433 family)
MSILQIEHIERTSGVCSGKPRISGRRITVQDIARWHYGVGWPPEKVAAEFDLTLGQVHAALSFYHDHREQIDRAIAEDREYIARMRALEEGRIGS